jgi:predicted metal-binding membrane protein
MLGVGAYPGSGRVIATGGTAWVLTAALVASSAGGDFEHGALDRAPAHPWLVATLAGGWVLMVAAMMVPTTLPLVSSATRALGREATSAVLAGYVSVWLVAGVAMHAGDLGVHWVAHHWAWLGGHTWAIAAATLAIAGLYQFSPAKRRFLSCCRAPDRLLESATPFRAGLAHGTHCLACCWALMLVMFSVGVASVAWMLALTVAMVAEKVTSAGQRASAPVGVWLLCCAALTVAAG